MYDWLTDALGGDSSYIVTANRRLARTLFDRYGQMQVEAGRAAWRRPAVYSWTDWLAVLADSAGPVDELPLRINAAQSRLLWERCLAEDTPDPLIRIASLARLCRETWLRMHQWCVPLAECQARAHGSDQRIFARAAGRYAAALDERHWVDDAGLPDCLRALLGAGGIAAPARIVLAGFDRVSPQATALVEAFGAAGTSVSNRGPGERGASGLRSYDNPDAELRAAGAWARTELERDPGLTVGIVVSNLEQDAERCGRLLREGLEPGWQFATPSRAAALNLSYGRRLADYPAIHAALLALEWLFSGLRGAEISVLLRSPYVGRPAGCGRSVLELKLRDQPDRDWTLDLFLEAQQSVDGSRADVDDWLGRLQRVSAMLADRTTRRRPPEWAAFVDEALELLNWPGEGSLTSRDFQLDNRWRQLLNEFSRLELVHPAMQGAEAVSRLRQMAGDTVFQAETPGSAVQVLGPLEAAGLRFDRLWVCGVTAADWPPPSRPVPLLSFDLQREFGMPDASPEDTAAYSDRVLGRLARSGSRIVFSYPAMIGDARQLPATLLGDLEKIEGDGDPGWFAASMAASLPLVEQQDRVPAVRGGEVISGGAATLNHQFHDPFSAFAYGRLGIRRLQEFSPGIAATLRGNLVHGALFRLYRERPARSDILAWSDEDLRRRVERALGGAFSAQRRFADPVLRQLLAIERRRSRALLHAVVALDRDRAEFTIDRIETGVDATIGELCLRLRIDRIDRLPDGSMLIFDYKTGRCRPFLSGGAPRDRQLVVYACAIGGGVAGLGLFNVDSRQVSIDGVGPGLEGVDDWPRTFEAWRDEVREAAARIAAGDVRLNSRQSSREALPLGLLSRFAEIRHDA